MKKFFQKILTIGITAFLFHGCTPQTVIDNSPKPMNLPLQTVEMNREFILSPGQEAIILSTGISIYFLNVEDDSRCASDVQCIAQGTVEITVNVSKDGKPLQASPFSFEIGKNRQIGEDYALKFLKIDPERGKQSQEIRKADYRATFKVVNTMEPEVPIIEIINPSGVIFTKEALMYNPFIGIGIETTDSWTPSIDDAKKTDQIVKKCISNKEKIAIDIVKFYPEQKREEEKKFYVGILEKIEPIYFDYKRQYRGFIAKNGHKLMAVNFFLPDEENLKMWKRSLIMRPQTSVRSSYHGIFEAFVDMDNQDCLYFSLGA